MSKPARPLAARLVECSVRDDESGCVLFTGHLDKQGYGRVYVASVGEKQLVHRVAYEVFVGPIPEGFEVDHLCGVRHCINSFHLEAVTPRENTRRARNGWARRTHCIHGHEFTTANTRPRKDRVGRTCRRCDADRAAASRERKAA